MQVEAPPAHRMYFRFNNSERCHQGPGSQTPDALYFDGRRMPKAA